MPSWRFSWHHGKPAPPPALQPAPQGRLPEAGGPRGAPGLGIGLPVATSDRAAAPWYTAPASLPHLDAISATTRCSAPMADARAARSSARRHAVKKLQAEASARRSSKLTAPATATALVALETSRVSAATADGASRSERMACARVRAAAARCLARAVIPTQGSSAESASAQRSLRARGRRSSATRRAVCASRAAKPGCQRA